MEPSIIESSTMEYNFSQFSAIIQLDLLFRLFSLYAFRELKLSVPDNFVALAAKELQQCTLQHGKDDWDYQGGWE